MGPIRPNQLWKDAVWGQVLNFLGAWLKKQLTVRSDLLGEGSSLHVQPTKNWYLRTANTETGCKNVLKLSVTQDCNYVFTLASSSLKALSYCSSSFLCCNCARHYCCALLFIFMKSQLEMAPVAFCCTLYSWMFRNATTTEKLWLYLPTLCQISISQIKKF